jgi:hypothetical protein
MSGPFLDHFWVLVVMRGPGVFGAPEPTRAILKIIWDDRGVGEVDGSAAATVWVVWRQDDNGNRYEVARRESRASASALAEELEARGHKQTYWFAPLTS